MNNPTEPNQRGLFYLYSYDLPRRNTEEDDGILIDVQEKNGMDDRLCVVVKIGEKTKRGNLHDAVPPVLI